MAVNFTKNQDDITKAWRHVVDSKDSDNWSVFGYEGTTNNIKPMTTGTNGLGGMVQELNCSLIQYAFCRVIDKEIGLNKLVLVNWQGDSSPLSRKGLCASHLGDVVSYFKGCTQTITIRNEDEATQEYLMQQIVKSSSSRVNVPKQQQAAPGNNITSTNSTTNNEISKVGSSYTRTEISSDIAVDRKSFWQRQEEEEKERLLEEKKRAFEKQAQFEKERKLREESEAKKLAETIKERDRIIEATRQAERRELTNSSQPNSIIANQSNADDDERVGRRSELIRLERNQETLSIISKGLIKNKRAIFENASQQQQQQQTNPRQSYGTTRRSSGAMIAERLNNFKSLDSNSTASSSNDASVEKIANGIAEQVKLSDSTNNSDTSAVGSNNSAGAPVKREVETVKIIPEPQEQQVHSSSVEKQVDNVVEKQVENLSASANGSGGDEELKQNGQKVTNVSGDKEESKVKEDPKVIDTNGNNNHIDKSPNNNKQEVVKQAVVDGETILRSGGKHGILAKALYDYRASDETEISFDPDDIIGYIEKVDEGWWHGMVITGQYAGLSGLFPQNHVQEEES